MTRPWTRLGVLLLLWALLSYGAGGLMGVGVALAALLVGRGLGWLVSNVGGLALLAAGAVLTVTEGSLVASLDFARDRESAARVVMLGVIAVLTSAVGKAALETPSSLVPLRQTTSPAVANPALASALAGVSGGAVAALLGAGRTGPELGLAIVRTEARLPVGPTMADLPPHLRGSVVPVVASAFGPLDSRLLGAAVVALALAVVGWQVGGARRSSRPFGRVGLGATIVIAIVASVGTRLDTAMGVALVATALALPVDNHLPASFFRGLLFGLATFCRPEAVIGVLVLLGVEWTRRQRHTVSWIVSVAGWALVIGPATAWLGRTTDHSLAVGFTALGTGRVVVVAFAALAAVTGSREPTTSPAADQEAQPESVRAS